MDIKQEFREEKNMDVYATNVNDGSFSNIYVKWLEAKLTFTDVVASLLCVDSEGFSFIMEGETYNLLEESDTLYKIADDDGDEFWYDKKHFVKNKK
jgi:hypothetical protein